MTFGVWGVLLLCLASECLNRRMAAAYLLDHVFIALQCPKNGVRWLLEGRKEKAVDSLNLSEGAGSAACMTSFVSALYQGVQQWHWPSECENLWHL